MKATTTLTYSGGYEADVISIPNQNTAKPTTGSRAVLSLKISFKQLDGKTAAQPKLRRQAA